MAMKIQPKPSGFTLVEVMIALVIIGILAVLAYPSYMLYVLKSHRSDALAMLTQNQIILERCYAQNFSYNGTCGSQPSFPQTSTQGFYTITLSNLGASTYTLTATAIGNQVKDTQCISMSVNQSNVKTAIDTTGADQTTCWSGS